MANISQKINIPMSIDVSANLDKIKGFLQVFKQIHDEISKTGQSTDKLDSAISKTQSIAKTLELFKKRGFETSIRQLETMVNLASQVDSILKRMSETKPMGSFLTGTGVGNVKREIESAIIREQKNKAEENIRLSQAVESSISPEYKSKRELKKQNRDKYEKKILEIEEQRANKYEKEQEKIRGEEYKEYIKQQSSESNKYYSGLVSEGEIQKKQANRKPTKEELLDYQKYLNAQKKESDFYYSDLRDENIRVNKEDVKEKRREKKKRENYEYKQYIQNEKWKSKDYYDSIQFEGKVQNDPTQPSGLDKFMSSQVSAVGRLARYYASFELINGSINAMSDAMRETIMLQDKMLEVKKFLPINTSVKELENNVYALAKAYGVSAETVLNSYSEFAQQGMKANQILDATKAALLGVNVASIDFAESTKFLTTATNVWNYNLSQSTTLFDKLSKVQAISAVTAQAMISAIQKTGSIAHDVGVSMDELLGYIAAITEKTQQSGEVTGNALKTMFERLLRSDSIRKLESMDPLKGITFRNIQTGELEKAGVILSQIAGKWKDLTDIERKSIGEVIAGGRQINTFTALMSNFDSAVKLTGESLNSLGFAQQQNQTEMQKFTKNAQILKNVFLELTTSALMPFIFATNTGMKAMSLFGNAGSELARVVIPGMILGLSAMALTYLPSLIKTLAMSTGAVGSLAKSFILLNNGITIANLTGFMSIFGPAIIGVGALLGTVASAWDMYNSKAGEAQEKTEATTKTINDLSDALIKLGKNVQLSDLNKELEKLTSESISALPERIQRMLSFGEGGKVSLAKGADPKALRRAILAEKVYAPTEEKGVRPVDVLKQFGIDEKTEITIDKVQAAYGKLQERIDSLVTVTDIQGAASIKVKQGYEDEYNKLLQISDKFKELAGLKKDYLGIFESITPKSFVDATQAIASLVKTQESLSIKPQSEGQEKLEMQKAIIEEIGIEMEKGLFIAQQKNKEFDIENELLENLKAQQFELGVKEIELREQVNKGIDGAKDKYDEVIKKNEAVTLLMGDQKNILQNIINLLNKDYFLNIRFNIEKIIGENIGGLSGINLGKAAISPSGTNLQKTAEEAKARREMSTKEYLKYASEVDKINQQLGEAQIKIDKNNSKNIFNENDFRKLDTLKTAQITAKSQEDLYSKTADQKIVKEKELNRKIQEEKLKIQRAESKSETRAGGAGQKTAEDKAHLEALRKVREMEAQISLEKQFQSYWESKLEDSYLLRYDRETEALQIQIDNNKNILESVKGLNEEDRNRYNEKIKELNTELDARKKNREEAIKINEEEKRAKGFKRSLSKADEQFSFRQELNAISFSGRYGITPEEQAAFNIQQQYESVLFERQKAKTIYQEKYRITLDSIIAKQKTQKDFSMEMAKQQAIQLTLQSEEVQNADEAVIKQQQKLEILYRQTEQQERQRAFAGVDEIKGVISGLFDTFNPITIYEQQKAKAKQMSEAYAEMAQAQSAANTAARDVASAEATGNIDKINSAREKYNQTLNQIEEVKKKMQDINSETNKWADALKSIGNILFKKIADQVADIFIKKTGIADMFANLFLGIGGLGGKQQTQSAMFGGGAAGITTAMVGAMAFPSMAGMGGGAGLISGGNQAIINVMAQKQQGLGGMMNPMMGTSTGLGKWLNEPLDKWGGTGMGYLSSGLMGYGVGQAIGSKGGGALAGGLLGYLTAGPIGGLLGAIGGFFGGDKDEEPTPPPVKEREFYSTQKNVDALDRNTAALMKLSEGVFNAPSTFEMPRLDAKSNISQVINVYVGPGSNSKNISSGVSDAVYKANMATFGTKTSNVVG